MRLPLYLSSEDEKIRFYEDSFIEGKFGINLLPTYFETVVSLVYVILIIRLINGDKNKHQWLWAKKLSYAFVPVIFIHLAGTILMRIEPVYSFSYAYLQYIGLAFLILIVAYNLMYRSELIKATQVAFKYKNSKMGRAQIEEYTALVKQCFEKERPFLDPFFNQSQLANAIGISNNNLSQALNAGVEMTFTDLVNKYRVEEMKRRLCDNRYKNLTLLAIGYDVGFNSKSSMARNFKKFTGTTPSQYLKKNAAHPIG
ncbi:helix-turn-helix domain-containing protein [Flagellimonas meishanensis]|uniref:helix-turn-helix domain-containing protein n=1 Tax=Flagellimonas meishanensis TaxID=2873264 RepID=UPI001CA64486|nr:helix-turn-helix domain-containing protein [[Muricauda] meishanensis]